MGSLPGSAAAVHGGGNMTLREYISFWQETYDKHQSRPTTYAAHNYVFKNHILPSLGDIPLSELTSEMIGDFLLDRSFRIGNVFCAEIEGIREKSFEYVYEADGKQIVEDCKGVKTAEYKLKKKLMAFINHINIEES